MAPPLANRRRTRRGRARKSPAFHVEVFLSMLEPWEPWDRGWADLPADALSCVLHKLDLVELLLGGVADVCRSWRHAAREEPELWRRIDMSSLPNVPPFTRQATLENVMWSALQLSAGQCHTFRGGDILGRIDDDLFLFLVKHAPSLKVLHLSRQYHMPNGGFSNTIRRKLPLLETFHGDHIDDELFLFLAEQAPSLKRLHLISCYHISNGGFANAIKKLPLLEDLELVNCIGVEEFLQVVAKVCRCLKSLTVFQKKYYSYRIIKQQTDDRKAFAIARMHGLRSLKLVGDDLGNEGLTAIINNCPHLEYLQIRDCCNINMDSNLTSKCARIIMDYYKYFPPSKPSSGCDYLMSWFSDYDYDPGDYHDLSLYSYLGDDIDCADFEEHERTLDVKSMRRYLS